MAVLQTCPGHREFKVSLSMKFHLATSYLFLVLLLLLTVSSLVQALELVVPFSFEPAQLMDPAECGFCYLLQCKELDWISARGMSSLPVGRESHYICYSQ